MRPKQQGQVLWLIVVVLGGLAQLAIITIQQAAASGLSVRRIESYWQREILVEHIAERLRGLPLQRMSSSDHQALWHPLGPLLRTACASEAHQSLTQTPCSPTTTAHWAWQLERDDASVGSWPGVLTQHYRLRIQATSRSGRSSRWQINYEQRSLP